MQRPQHAFVLPSLPVADIVAFVFVACSASCLPIMSPGNATIASSQVVQSSAPSEARIPRSVASS